ncbi:hypothetical protein [Stenotrophomonas geniculata]|uniref:hypothetical protein n=1 Tax=Stenotrophomonas geniculata TaxID=86188 RepID=UPI00070E699F|nr:hypothetical protein [Stenotrophomonas geniculata]KRG40357.1 hypothetical protein ARC63_15220 [Stenotrophomonas geniculata ATCC 19374 = JCM 13324]
MTQSTAVKNLSPLALIIAGVTAAGVASAAAPNSTFVNDIAASTSIQADMQSLSISEFTDEKSVLLADGHHHSDSIGSHHHHDTASKQMVFASRSSADSRFDV